MSDCLFQHEKEVCETKEKVKKLGMEVEGVKSDLRMVQSERDAVEQEKAGLEEELREVNEKLEQALKLHGKVSQRSNQGQHSARLSTLQYCTICWLIMIQSSV